MAPQSKMPVKYCARAPARGRFFALATLRRLGPLVSWYLGLVWLGIDISPKKGNSNIAINQG